MSLQGMTLSVSSISGGTCQLITLALSATLAVHSGVFMGMDIFLSFIQAKLIPEFE